jgi:Flp pilus assembly protein TadD
MATVDELYDEAIAIQQRGDIAQAIERLHKLVEQDPSFALAHSALSVFYSRQDEHAMAVSHAQKVCDLEPSDPFSFVALSLVCQKAGQIAEAEQAMMRARQAQFAAGQS